MWTKDEAISARNRYGPERRSIDMSGCWLDLTCCVSDAGYAGLLRRDSYHVNSVCVRRHRNNDALRANYLGGPETRYLSVRAQQIVGRERRERLSQPAVCGGGCFGSRRPRQLNC